MGADRLGGGTLLAVATRLKVRDGVIARVRPVQNPDKLEP